MAKQLFFNALKAVGISSFVIIIGFVIFVPPRFVFLHVAGHSGQKIGHVSVSVDRLFGFGKNPLSLGNNFVFIILGEDNIIISAKGFERAEVVVGKNVEAFLGNIEHTSILSLFHKLNITLAKRDKNLKMIKYQGVLTTPGKNLTQVIAIHPKYRSAHMPLKWLKRQNIPFLPYIMLKSRQDANGNVMDIVLDFSTANGGVKEYIPPMGWRTGNRFRRIAYSMWGRVPETGYKNSLIIPKDQSETPYKMGETFFYCLVDGHYCGGYVTCPRKINDKQWKVTAVIWVNLRKGDPRIRGLY